MARTKECSKAIVAFWLELWDIVVPYPVASEFMDEFKACLLEGEPVPEQSPLRIQNSLGNYPGALHLQAMVPKSRQAQQIQFCKEFFTLHNTEFEIGQPDFVGRYLLSLPVHDLVGSRILVSLKNGSILEGEVAYVDPKLIVLSTDSNVSEGIAIAEVSTWRPVIDDCVMEGI